MILSPLSRQWKKLHYTVVNILLKGDFSMAGKNQAYSNDLKLKVVQAYLEGNESTQKIAEKYGIQNR